MKKSSSKDIACLPAHVAIIMDGNGRWAKKRGLSRLEGHKAGVDNVRPIIETADDYGIKYLTLYGFSTENWSRPKLEIKGLMQLLGDRIDREAQELNKKGVIIRHLGRMSELPPSIQRALKRAIELTKNNHGLTLNFAFNYGGRTEILDAIRSITVAGINPKKIEEKTVGDHLYTAGMPDVDLVIRTSGELRTSNFLIWQAAYAEYYFTKVLWPDFNADELRKALRAYSRRHRRFGGL